MIKHIKFSTVCVRDQDKALAFWTEAVGFSVATDQPMGNGMRWIEIKIPGAQTGLVLFTPEGEEGRIGSFSGISFHTDDVERTHKELAAKGVEFVQPPKRETWGSSAIFKDPDGNTFVLSGR